MRGRGEREKEEESVLIYIDLRITLLSPSFTLLPRPRACCCQFQAKPHSPFILIIHTGQAITWPMLSRRKASGSILPLIAKVPLSFNACLLERILWDFGYRVWMLRCRTGALRDPGASRCGVVDLVR